MSFFGFITRGLAKTKDALSQRIGEIFGGRPSIEAGDLEDIEAVLLQADMGPAITSKIIASLRENMQKGERADRQMIESAIEEIIKQRLSTFGQEPSIKSKPHVIMMLGVNGTGKTTSAGKIAFYLSKTGAKVMLAAADTFRAAAIEQLEIWASRTGSEVIKHKEGSDPSAVAFDACSAALTRGVDCLIIDTAGRLHTKGNLMEELKKVNRVVGAKIDGAPHEVLLVIDATTGQNGLVQAREFNKAVTLTGIVLTKLDGTARGGIVVAVMEELGIPVKFVGVGEGVEDLRPFDSEEFAHGLFH